MLVVDHQERPVIDTFLPLIRRAGLAVALAAAIGLAACGRKGPLDPPPGAATPGEPRAATPASTAAPPPPDRRVPLDVLLD
jgi:predicted small lipoprotein YifL